MAYRRINDRASRTCVKRHVTRFGLVSLVLAVAITFLVLPGVDIRPFYGTFEQRELTTANWQVDADDECRIALASERPREGMQAIRIAAPRGGRCELVPRTFPAFLDKFLREPFGELRWYRFSVLVQDAGAALPTGDLGKNTVIAQWHSSPDPFIFEEGGRGPPLALRIQNSKWAITYSWDEDFRSKGEHSGFWHWAGPVEPGEWVDWRALVRWSYEEDGLTKIWRNDQLIFQRAGPNTYNDVRGVYLKLGIYHPTDDMSILLDRVAVTGPESKEG